MRDDDLLLVLRIERLLQPTVDEPRFRGLSETPMRGWLIPDFYECDGCDREVSLDDIHSWRIPSASPAVPAVSVFHRCGTLVFSRVFSADYVLAFRRLHFPRFPGDRISSEDYEKAWAREDLRVKGWRYYRGLGPRAKARDITPNWGVLRPVRGLDAKFPPGALDPPWIRRARQARTTMTRLRRIR